MSVNPLGPKPSLPTPPVPTPLSPTPPPMLLRVAALVLARHNRDYIIGDLLEAFESDSARLGCRRAGRRLWRELGATVFWDVLGQVRENVRRVLRGARVQVSAGGGVLAQRPQAHRRRLLGIAVLLGVSLPLLYLMGRVGADPRPRFHLQSIGGGPEVSAGVSAQSAKTAILLKLMRVEGWSTRGGPILGLFSAAAAPAPVSITVILGRALGVGDDAPEVAVAVLMERAWMTRLAGSEDVIGSTLIVDGKPVNIVGVVSMDFDWSGPEPQLWLATPAEVIARLGSF